MSLFQPRMRGLPPGVGKLDCKREKLMIVSVLRRANLVSAAHLKVEHVASSNYPDAFERLLEKQEETLAKVLDGRG